MLARSLLALAVVALVAPSASAEPVLVEREDLLRLIDKAQGAAKDLDTQIAKLGPVAPAKLKGAAKTLKARLADLEALAKAAMTPAPPAPAPPCVATTCPASPIAPAVYTTLVGQVKAAPFAADKIKAIEAAAASARFTGAQAAELLGLLSFPKDRLEALGAIASCASDLTAASRDAILAYFTFSADRAQAEALLSR